MQLTNLSKKSSRGQMLLSVLIATGVFAILASAIFTLVAASFDFINFNRSRIAARYIAQERIETIRNLPYDSIGTDGGVPSGNLPQEENVKANGLNYLVKTSIVYIDDPFNGGPPNNTDYKRARIEVSWEGLAASKKNPVVLITDIEPGQNEENAEGGSLVVLVYDADGSPLQGADVTITAPTDPVVNLVQQTNSNGEVSIPGAPLCISCYSISVTKSGYSTDRTYSEAEVTNPIKPETSVIDGEITQISFAIDEVGTISISSKDSRANNFTNLANVSFQLRGNKIIGTDAYGKPVYKYDSVYQTDSGGNFNLSNAEWDTYQVLMPAPTSWDISGNIPLQPLSLIPGGSITLTFSVEPSSTNSFLAIVKDPSQNLIASASARLTLSGYDESIYTGATESADFGQAFFSGLTEDTYTVTATASGYTNFNGTFDVSGYTTGQIVLTPE